MTIGLEFLKDVCIDTHFIDRSRCIRLAQIIATNPTSTGIGIEEDTAIIIRKGSEAEVTGNNIVTIIEGFGITDTNITACNENTIDHHILGVHHVVERLGISVYDYLFLASGDLLIIFGLLLIIPGKADTSHSHPAPVIK